MKQLALVLVMMMGCGLATLSVADSEPALTGTQQAAAVKGVVNILTREHYPPVIIEGNNDFSKKVFSKFLKQVDPLKFYFTKVDIDSFYKKDYANKFDNIDKFQAYYNEWNVIEKETWQEPANSLFNLSLQGRQEQMAYYLRKLDAGVDKINLNEQDSLVLDPDKTNWPVSEEAQKKRWDSFLKYQILSLKLSGASLEEIQKKLEARFSEDLKETKMQEQHLKQGAFEAYLESMALALDPHSEYFPPADASTFSSSVSGSFEGIGAVLSKKDGEVKIMDLLLGGPAAKSGLLKPGDRIIEVNKNSVDGLKLDDIVSKVRGNKGSEVTLTFLSKNSLVPKKVTLVRDKIDIKEQEVSSKILSIQRGDQTYKIGVITIPVFYGDGRSKSVSRDVRKALEGKLKNIDGLVVDVSNNGGGLLPEAQMLTGLFIKTGPVVYTRNQESITSLVDNDPEELYQGPLVVMVNHLSASASEIFSGAIQDYQRGIIVGSPTYGKGTVQTMMEPHISFLPPFGSLKYTVSMFFRPGGVSTQLIGVKPDIFFPSYYDEYGESFSDNSLKESHILPGDLPGPRVNRYPSFSQYIPELTRAHNDRSSHNPGLVYLQARSAYEKAISNEQQTIILSEEYFLKKNKEVEDARLAFANKFRQAHQLDVLKNPEDWGVKDEKLVHNDEQLEAANIVLDYGLMKKQDQGGNFVVR